MQDVADDGDGDAGQRVFVYLLDGWGWKRRSFDSLRSLRMTVIERAQDDGDRSSSIQLAHGFVAALSDLMLTDSEA